MSHPVQCAREEKWLFKESFPAPWKVPADEHHMRSFSHLIWDYECRQMLPGLDATPQELAQLCGEGSNEWILSCHVTWVLDKLNGMAGTSTKCFALDTIGPGLLKSLQQQKEQGQLQGFIRLTFIVNVGRESERLSDRMIQEGNSINHQTPPQPETEGEIEIINFYRPVGNGKNLFVSNIAMDLEEDEALCRIQTALYKAFSGFGPIYEIQVFHLPSHRHVTQDQGDGESSKDSHQLSAAADVEKSLSDGNSVKKREENASFLRFYAFVKFYSAMCAKRAKLHLNMTSVIGVKPIKITFAARKKAEKQHKLYLHNCYDLANFYLGFNGWVSSILVMKRDDLPPCESKGHQTTCRFLCIVELTIINHGLTTQGVGTADDSWNVADISSKSAAIARCHKRSYHCALENAFSKLLIVTLGNGKVHVEVDTVKADPLHRLESLQNLHLVTVNELEEEPKEPSDDEDWILIAQDTLNKVDDENVNILMELEAGISD